MSEMLSCDEAQVWVERARHEALGAAERLTLEDHLATCAACTAWQNAVGQMEATLGAQAAHDLETMSWSRMERVVRSRRWRTHTSFLFAGVALILMNVGLVALVGVEHLAPSDVLQGLLPELALVSALWLLAPLLDRTRRSLGAEETLVALRKDLANDLRSLKLARWLVLGCALFLAVVACWPAGSGRSQLVVGGFGVAPLLGFVLLQWSLLPRLRRELADLAVQDT